MRASAAGGAARKLGLTGEDDSEAGRPRGERRVRPQQSYRRKLLTRKWGAATVTRFAFGKDDSGRKVGRNRRGQRGCERSATRPKPESGHESHESIPLATQSTQAVQAAFNELYCLFL